MGPPILAVDSRREIVLAAPRLLPAVAAAVFLAFALAVYAFFPGFRFAQGFFLFLGLGFSASALHVHRLRLDLGSRTFSYRDGWIFLPPRRRGTFDEIAGVTIDRNENAGGTRLRSRLLHLEFRGWPEGEGSFLLGFPMGPTIAADKAADYARRLGVEVVDRTADEPASVEDTLPA